MKDFLFCIFNFRRFQKAVKRANMELENLRGLLRDTRQELLDILSSNDIGEMSKTNLKDACERIERYRSRSPLEIYQENFKEFQ
jgi:uncharacterized sporulation protein YeaH/YhbH (DUF444 family)